ncbi:MAG: hypothetical protein C5B52_12035 [Bacteroidetes bacterium]|nr:MAG: hypothetical protein C5B52_12035 [Bacteroidota bacterium]
MIYYLYKVKSAELIRILRRDCWYVIRKSGSHMIMVHPSKSGKLVVPNHGSAEVGNGASEENLKRRKN